MYCSKCGFQNDNVERFCKNCGILLENSQPQQQVNNNFNSQVQQPMYNCQPSSQYQNNNGELDSKMKKWAILSIVVPIVAIIWYWFIGLSFYLAIFIAVVGFGFSEKGSKSSKKIANIGKICNGVLIGMALIMFILRLINIIN